jgi:hypothetical protein
MFDKFLLNLEIFLFNITAAFGTSFVLCFECLPEMVKTKKSHAVTVNSWLIRNLKTNNTGEFVCFDSVFAG